MIVNNHEKSWNFLSFSLDDSNIKVKHFTSSKISVSCHENYSLLYLSRNELNSDIVRRWLNSSAGRVQLVGRKLEDADWNILPVYTFFGGLSHVDHANLSSCYPGNSHLQSYMYMYSAVQYSTVCYKFNRQFGCQQSRYPRRKFWCNSSQLCFWSWL